MSLLEEECSQGQVRGVLVMEWYFDNPSGDAGKCAGITDSKVLGQVEILRRAHVS